MTTLARVRTVFTGVAGTPWYSNLHFDADATTSVPLAGYVAEFWGTLDTVLCNDVTWAVEPEITIIEDTTGQTTGTGNWAGATAVGNAADDPLPFATQGLINLNTGVYVGGRQIRGKMFIPAFTEAANGQGAPNTGAIAAMQDTFDELLADANGTLRVYSPTRNTSAAVTSGSVSQKWAVLRSRRD